MSDTADVILYTDGACSGNPGPGGWAAILKHPATGSVKKLSGGEPDTTNNRMEMMAVIEGLRSLTSTQRCAVRLVSDSEYVIKGLTQWIKGWIANDWRRGKKPGSPPVKNVDLWQTLHELAQRFDMTYQHVRGHTGHPENEECDRLAVDAIRRGTTECTCDTPDGSPALAEAALTTPSSQTSPSPTSPTLSMAATSPSPSPPTSREHEARRAFTGTKWEQQVGYCRAIRVGDVVHVTGTAPVDEDGATFAPGNAYRQAKRCFEIIERALGDVGAAMSDVVRTRMYVTNLSRWAEYGSAHREFFADHPPATTMVEVKSLIAPDMLIEIEADAICRCQ